MRRGTLHLTEDLRSRRRHGTVEGSKVDNNNFMTVLEYLSSSGVLTQRYSVVRTVLLLWCLGKPRGAPGLTKELFNSNNNRRIPRAVSGKSIFGGDRELAWIVLSPQTFLCCDVTGPVTLEACCRMGLSGAPKRSEKRAGDLLVALRAFFQLVSLEGLLAATVYCYRPKQRVLSAVITALL